MSFWNNAFAGNPFLEVWDNRPGGTVVDRYSKDGVEFVSVEFEKSPGTIYTFYA